MWPIPLPFIHALILALHWYGLRVTSHSRIRRILSDATRHMTQAECEMALAINLGIVARYKQQLRHARPWEPRFARIRRQLTAPRAHKALIMATVLREHIAAYAQTPAPTYLRSRRYLWRTAPASLAQKYVRRRHPH